jgi:hypothetical protein
MIGEDGLTTRRVSTFQGERSGDSGILQGFRGVGED